MPCVAELVNRSLKADCTDFTFFVLLTCILELMVAFFYTTHLQWTYSARETGVMQELEKHNLTRITDAPAAFLI